MSYKKTKLFINFTFIWLNNSKFVKL
jgi:hypothetical protein